MSEKKITKVKFLLVLERRSGVGEDLGKVTKGLLAFSPASSSATSLRVLFPVPPARCNCPLLRPPRGPFELPVAPATFSDWLQSFHLLLVLGRFQVTPLQFPQHPTFYTQGTATHRDARRGTRPQAKHWERMSRSWQSQLFGTDLCDYIMKINSSGAWWNTILL